MINFANEIEDMANEIEKIRVELQDIELMSLADRIVQVIEEGKQALAISINEIIKTTYWKIGQYIVEFEQQGNVKAKYKDHGTEGSWDGSLNTFGTTKQWTGA